MFIKVSVTVKKPVVKPCPLAGNKSRQRPRSSRTPQIVGEEKFLSSPTNCWFTNATAYPNTSIRRERDFSEFNGANIRVLALLHRESVSFARASRHRLSGGALAVNHGV